MTKKGMSRIQRGQAITFRLPSDTPDHIIRQLQKLKETEKRNFSSKIAEFALKGVSGTLAKDRDSITIPLPKPLTAEQRNWLKHSHSEALLGSIVYHLLADPIRATSVLASLNSNALNIDDALYLQELDSSIENDSEGFMANFSEPLKKPEIPRQTISRPGEIIAAHQDDDDDLLNFNLDMARDELAITNEGEKEEEDAEDLLGDFLTKMNG